MSPTNQQTPDPRFIRRKLRVLLAVAVVVLVAVIVIIVASTNQGESYQAFRDRCLSAPGDSVVTVTTTVRNVAMGAPEIGYKMGCRQPNGTIIATIETNHR